MEYLIPAIQTENRLSSAADNAAPEISDPPEFIRIGPIVLVEYI
jgi:hypothetical protein